MSFNINEAPFGHSVNLQGDIGFTDLSYVIGINPLKSS